MPMARSSFKIIGIWIWICTPERIEVDSRCYIGIHLSNTLNWTARTKVASNKAQQTLGVIRRNLNKCSTHIKAVAYTSLVRPILEYASSAWDPQSQNNIIKKHERIQTGSTILHKKLFQGTRICNKTFTRTRIGNPSNEKKSQKNHHFI